MIKSTDIDDKLLLELLEQSERERVSPKLEQFRNKSIGGNCPENIRIKIARGGRGAGAKSWGFASLIVQRAQYEKIRIGAFREIQQSLEESVYALIRQTVERLNYSGWKFTKEYIESPTGSHFIFRGLKDMLAASQVKSLEGFNIFYLEEAARISRESLDMLMPTLMRTPAAELWAAYNPETEQDPIAEKIWNRNRDDALCIELRPGATDNPWWNIGGLQKEMDEDYKYDPDEAEHIWGGMPRKQGQKSIFSRSQIRGAMERSIEAIGQIEIGADIARFGDDKTIAFKRHGMKIIDKLTLTKTSTTEISRRLWDFSGRDKSIPIRIDDTGVGGGVTDNLREIGARVIPINFAECASDKMKYGDIISELWFGLPIDEIDIPNDPELMRQLSGRQFYYDASGRRCVEQKSEYKKRLGRSPDDADALLLTFLNNYNIKMPESVKNDIRLRRESSRLHDY
jgi:phage terminase large subunit